MPFLALPLVQGILTGLSVVAAGVGIHQGQKAADAQAKQQQEQQKIANLQSARNRRGSGTRS